MQWLYTPPETFLIALKRQFPDPSTYQNKMGTLIHYTLNYNAIHSFT